MLSLRQETTGFSLVINAAPFQKAGELKLTGLQVLHLPLKLLSVMHGHFKVVDFTL